MNNKKHTNINDEKNKQKKSNKKMKLNTHTTNKQRIKQTGIDNQTI